MKTPHSIDLQWWMRARASSRTLVWVANRQIPARGGNRPSTLLQGAWEMGLGFIRSQIQLLSSGPHQIGPNLRRECHNDIMPALAAATAGRVCVCVCKLDEERGWWRRRKKQMTLSARLLIELQPRNAEGRIVPLISLCKWMMLMQTARLMSQAVQPAPLKETCFVPVSECPLLSQGERHSCFKIKVWSTFYQHSKKWHSQEVKSQLYTVPSATCSNSSGYKAHLLLFWMKWTY